MYLPFPGQVAMYLILFRDTLRVCSLRPSRLILIRELSKEYYKALKSFKNVFQWFLGFAVACHGQ